MYVVGCGVCECTSGRFCCNTCVNSQVQGRRQLLQSLLKGRDALEETLNKSLRNKNAKLEQEVKRVQLKDAISLEGRRAKRAQADLQEAKEAVEKLKAQNEARGVELARALSRLQAQRSATLSRQFPTLLRYQSLTYSHVSAMLLREQKLKLKQLLDILPLRVTGISSGAGAAVQVSICDLKVPESVSVPLNGWQQPEAVSAAMGYLMLFLDLVSTYLGGPLLHEGSFQGSTTVLWQQTTFWNRRPACSNGVLPLYLDDSSANSSPFPALSNKPKGASRGWSAMTLLRSTSSYMTPVASPPRTLSSSSERRGAAGTNSMPDTQVAGSQAGGGAGPSGACQSNMSRPVSGNGDLRLAFDMLQRSTSCLVRDKARALNLQLPAAWGPVGWLVMLCSYLFKDSRTDGVIAAATMSVLNESGASDSGRVYLEDGMEAEEAHGDRSTSSDPSRHGADSTSYDESDGWDMLGPMMPPPPSEPEEVEHWTRAMFTDASSSARFGTTGIQSAAGGITAALQVGSRSLSRRSTTDAIRGLLGAGMSAVGTLSGRGT